MLHHFAPNNNNPRVKESNKNPNYNENSIAICSMFTHLKTITVLCAIDNGILLYGTWHGACVATICSKHTLSKLDFSHQLSTIIRNGWNEINCALTENLHCERGARGLYHYRFAHTSWLHLTVWMHGMDQLKFYPHIYFPFDSVQLWQYRLIN